MASSLTNQRPLHIIILAAGKGTRMHSSVPKVLHQLAGAPLLEHVVSTAKKLNPSQIHVVVGHGKQQVESAFEGEKIKFVDQAEQLGTGHAVQQAINAIDNDSNCLVLYGDVPLIAESTLQSLVNSIDSFSLALLTSIVDDPTGYGRILRDETNSACGIVEQKDATIEQCAINEINTGFLCARTEKLKTWLQQIDNDNAQKEFYLTDIVKLAHDAGEPINTLQPTSNNEIIGINNRVELAKVERIYQLSKAEQFMKSGVTVVDPNRLDIRGEVSIAEDTIIDVNCVIIGKTEIDANVTIHPNCVISNSKIGSGTTIHANTVIENAIIGTSVNVGPFARIRPGTELGDEVRIGNFVETKNAKLKAGAKANHLSYVGDSEVGSNTNIGAGVITCNYDGANKHKTKIGNDVFVGSDSQLVAPVTIEDGATIGAGSTITNNVEKNQLAISRSRQRQIDGWKRPSKN